MATLEQLSAGLVKADAAGNAADAKVFADEIRRIRSTTPDAPKAALDRGILQTESAGNWNVQRSDTKATGGYQITPVYLKDANKFMGTSYTLEDMKDPQKAQAAKDAYDSHYGAQFVKDNGRQPTAREMAMIHFAGPQGYKKPNVQDSTGTTAED